MTRKQTAGFINPLGIIAPPSGPWWDPFDINLPVRGAFLAKGALSYAASMVDLSEGGMPCTDENGPVPWSAANGWEFDVGDLNAILPTFQITDDQEWSVFVQFANVANAGCLLGTTVPPGFGNGHFSIYPNNGGVVTYGNGGTATVAPAMTAGNLAVVGDQGYRNGAIDGGTLGAWNRPPLGIGQRIGALWNIAAEQWITAHVYAVAYYAGQVHRVRGSARLIASRMSEL